MSGLPTGWRRLPLGEVADTALGKMLDRGQDRGRPRVPYLRNVNVQWGRIDTDDILEMELEDDERERFGLQAGDLLLCEGGEIGRAAIWRGSTEYMAYQKALHRVRPHPEVDSRFLLHQFALLAQTNAYDGIATGSTIRHLPQQQLRRVVVVVPPLGEQRRIVGILEDHLSRLDAADTYLDAATGRADRLEGAGVLAALLGAREASSLARAVAAGDRPPLPAGWAWHELGDIADVVGGVTKDAKKQSGPGLVEVPYLRVANVQRTRLDLTNVTSIRVPEAKARALALQPGDVLMNEGGDRDKLARGWVWRGEIPGCIHQNHVYRARPAQSLVEPDWLAWCANTLGGEWAQRHGRQSVNLASISLSTIRRMPVPVPPLDEQRAGLGRIAALREVGSSAREAAVAARLRAATLRRTLLAAAFSGRLTGRSSDLELAEELIDA